MVRRQRAWGVSESGVHQVSDRSSPSFPAPSHSHLIFPQQPARGLLRNVPTCTVRARRQLSARGTLQTLVVRAGASGGRVASITKRLRREEAIKRDKQVRLHVMARRYRMCRTGDELGSSRSVGLVSRQPYHDLVSMLTARPLQNASAGPTPRQSA